MHLSPGTEVADGEYVVQSLLGAGGMAVVYKVVRTADDTAYALKVLNTTNPEQQGRLLREGRAQSVLRHPNVVTVAEVLRVGEQPALLMEFVDGPSLDRALKRISFTLEQVDALAQGMLRGMAAAHEAGFVHRDLKPANIMLAATDAEVLAKIADFGLVKTGDATGSTLAATRTGAMMGTPAYMAPEQVRDAKDVDARADVFALGAILYELVTRKRAFDGQDTFDVFEAIVRGRYDRLDDALPELPARMRVAVERALRTAPAERFASAGELLAAWCGEAPPLASGVWRVDELEAVRKAAPTEVEAGSDATWSSMEPAPDPADTAMRAAETLDGSLDRPPSPPARRWGMLAGGGILAVAMVAGGLAIRGGEQAAEDPFATSVPDPVVLGTDTLVWTENERATTLDPLFMANATDRRVADLLFEPLFYPNTFFEPNTADSRLVDAWYTEEDGTRLILELWEDRKWSDGEPFDAEDVCFTYEAMVDPVVGSTVAADAEAVLDCVVLGPLKVALELARPLRNPPFHVAWHIVPEHAFGDARPTPDDGFAKAPVGSGPLVGELDGDRVHFVANPHGKQSSIVKATVIGGESQLEQMERLERGQSHGMIDVAAAHRPTIVESDVIALKRYSPRRFVYVALNPRSDLLEDAAARRALDLALDREALLADSVGIDPHDPSPPTKPIAGPFLADTAFMPKDITPTAHDLDAATAEMTAAGAVLEGETWLIKGEPARIRLAVQAGVEYAAPGLADAIGKQAEANGFAFDKVVFSDAEWADKVLSGRSRNDFEAALGMEMVRHGVEDPSPMLHSRYRGLGERNIFAWSNSEVDALLDAAARAETRAEAREALRAAQYIVHRERPYIFLWQQGTKSAWHSDVRNNMLVSGQYFRQFPTWRLGP